MAYNYVHQVVKINLHKCYYLIKVTSICCNTKCVQGHITIPTLYALKTVTLTTTPYKSQSTVCGNIINLQF